MFNDRRIIVCIPCGRKRYLRALIPYLLNDRASIVDQVQLWVNTDVPEDLGYLQELEHGFPHRLKRISNPGRIVRERYDTTRANFIFADCIHHFYRQTVEPKTIYVKLDDDMCWLHPDCLTNLCAELLREETRCFLVSCNVVNVALTSWKYQQMGVLGTDAGVCTDNARCAVGCVDGNFARYLHERFLELHAANEVERLYFDSFDVVGRVRIGAVAYTGETFARFGGVVDRADEKDLTQCIAPRLGMPMRICGDALISHFSSAHQRAVLEDETDILERYRLIAVKETGIDV